MILVNSDENCWKKVFIILNKFILEPNTLKLSHLNKETSFTSFELMKTSSIKRFAIKLKLNCLSAYLCRHLALRKRLWNFWSKKSLANLVVFLFCFFLTKNG